MEFLNAEHVACQAVDVKKLGRAVVLRGRLNTVASARCIMLGGSEPMTFRREPVL